MKATRITMQITRQVRQFEPVRLEIEYILGDGDESIEMFKQAKNEIDNAFVEMYGIKPLTTPTPQPQPPKANTPPTPTKKPLAMNTPEFERVCSALYGQRTDRNEVATYYELTPEIITYFDKHNL